MRKERRLTRTQDFAALRAHGRSRSDRLLALVARRNSLEMSRFGFSISKRVGNAVVRNRMKRRLREIARGLRLQEGWDVLLIARKGSGAADFQALERSVRSLCERARLFAEPAEEARHE